MQQDENDPDRLAINVPVPSYILLNRTNVTHLRYYNNPNWSSKLKTRLSFPSRRRVEDGDGNLRSIECFVDLQLTVWQSYLMSLMNDK